MMTAQLPRAAPVRSKKYIRPPWYDQIAKAWLRKAPAKMKGTMQIPPTTASEVRWAAIGSENSSATAAA